MPTTPPEHTKNSVDEKSPDEPSTDDAARSPKSNPDGQVKPLTEKEKLLLEDDYIDTDSRGHPL